MDEFDEVDSNLGLDDMVKNSQKPVEAVKSWSDYLLCCQPRRLKYFFLRQFYEGLPESAWIEDVHELPDKAKDVITTLYQVSYYVLLAVLMYQSYQQSRTNSFISLDQNSGTCLEVGRPTTGQYMVSSGSNFDNFEWSTKAGFEFNTTFGELSLQSYTSE